jgi:hypothetical protein
MVVIGFLGRSEWQARVTVWAMVMVLMGPQAVPVFERAVHRARLPRWLSCCHALRWFRSVEDAGGADHLELPAQMFACAWAALAQRGPHTACPTRPRADT